MSDTPDLTQEENDLVLTAVQTLKELPKEEYGAVLIIAAALYPEAIIRAMEIRRESHVRHA